MPPSGAFRGRRRLQRAAGNGLGLVHALRAAHALVSTCANFQATLDADGAEDSPRRAKSVSALHRRLPPHRGLSEARTLRSCRRPPQDSPLHPVQHSRGPPDSEYIACGAAPISASAKCSRPRTLWARTNQRVLSRCAVDGARQRRTVTRLLQGNDALRRLMSRSACVAYLVRSHDNELSGAPVFQRIAAFGIKSAPPSPTLRHARAQRGRRPRRPPTEREQSRSNPRRHPCTKDQWSMKRWKTRRSRCGR